MKNQKSLTNKGFSLVELIIVVAIMAILIGVLAPQYLRYVEKSRLQKDNTSMGEIANVLKMTSSDEKMINAMGNSTQGVTITFGSTGVGVTVTAPADDTSVIEGELIKTLGSLEDLKLTSTTYVNGTLPVIKAVANSDNVIEVTATNWISAPGETPEVKKF